MAPRRTLDDTRHLLLETGAGMVVATGVDVSVANLSVIDVCREAGLTSAGSAYKIWARQEDYRADLLRHLLTKVIDDTTNVDTIAATFENFAGSMSFTEFVRTASLLQIEAYQRTPAFELYLALWLARSHDPELAESIAAADHEWLDAFTRLYESIGRHYGREFVPPYDAHDLALALSALVEGFVLRVNVHPEAADTPRVRATGPHGSDENWHLFGCAAQAIIEAFTRPSAPETSH